MSRHKKERKELVKFAIVRSWAGGAGVFRFYRVYSDGRFEISSRREALQYEEAYGKTVQTIVGEPTDNTYRSAVN